MNRITYMICLVALLIPGKALSQRVWSLTSCIEYAEENNLTIKNLNYSKDAGQELHRQSYRALLPTIDANSNYNIQYGRSIDPNSNDVSNTNFFSNTYGINASVDIFQGFQKLNTIASTKFIYRALEQEKEQEKYLLAFRVMQAFYDVQFFKELLTISQAQVGISEENCTLIKKQIELGLKAGADLYEANSLWVSDKLTLTQTKNSLRAAQLQLIQEMNLEGKSEIEIEKTNDLAVSLEKYSGISPEAVYQKALDFLPLIKARKLGVQSAEKQLLIAQGARLPRLSFFAGTGTSFFETNKDSETNKTIPFRTQFTDNTFQFIGLNLSIPISGGGVVHSRIKTSRITLLQAENDLEIQKQELNNIIQSLVQDYEASLAEYIQTKEQERFAKLSFEIAQKRFEKGLISILELHTSKNLYATAQNENLQVKLMLQVQEKTLAFYQGLPIIN